MDQLRKKFPTDRGSVEIQEDSEAVVPEPTATETPPVDDLPASGGVEPAVSERRYPARDRQPPDWYSP